MKILLFVNIILSLSLISLGQSPYEVSVNIPVYDASNPAMQLITPTNNGWSQINNGSKHFFYVQPGNYYDSIGTISLTADGTYANKRYIFLYNGNDTHPGKLNQNQLANVAFYVTGDHWVIDRMALFTNYVPPFRLENANNNVINRFFGLNSMDIGFRHGCDSNTVQNCRMEITNNTLYDDRPAFGMINQSNGVKIINAQITNTHIINNETRNFADGFQTVLHDGNDPSFYVTGTNYEGTIVDYNHFYIDSIMYTNCNGNYNVNGSCAYAENGVDLKVGSENANNPVIISNNIMWGFKQSDTNNSDLDDHGTGIAVHFGVNNVEISNNVVFNSNKGFTIAGTYPNMGTVPNRPMLNSIIKENILYNIHGHSFYNEGTDNIEISDNLFKNTSSDPSEWGWGKSWVAPSSGATCSNFTFTGNMVVDAQNNLGGVDHILGGVNVYSGNQYYNARPGDYSHSTDIIHSTDPTINYCDLVFTTDRYTNNPRNITLPKVLSPAQCVPCSPTSYLAIDTACFSYVWAINGQDYTTSGTYTAVSSISGCTHTDSLILTIDNSCPQPSGLYLEAECADSIGSYWSEVIDVNASNGKYLVAQSGIWNTDSSNWNGNYGQLALAYNFNITTAGSYHFNARAITATVSSDSFWFRINGGAWIYWDIIESSSLAWFQYGTVNLQSGANLLEIYFREGDFVLDKISFNTGSTIPFNIGGNATNCNNCTPTSTSQVTSACQTYTWLVNNQTYTTSGIYTSVSTNSSGCLHTDSLILTMSNNTNSSQTESACQSYLWSVNSQTYTVSGTYTNVFTNANGCTHTDNLILTIGSNSSSTEEVTTCSSYTWSVNGLVYTNSGTYINTAIIGNGCTQIDTLQLTLGLVDNTVTASATVLESNNQFGATYQWMNCVTEALIAGATNRVFEPEVDGTYAVIIEDAGCTDTSSCYSVVSVGMLEQQSKLVKVFPNPTTGRINIDLLNQKSVRIEIYNPIGKLVFYKNLSENQSEIDLSNYASGIYILRVCNGEIDEKLKIIKK